MSGCSAEPCAAGCAAQPAFHSAYVVQAVKVTLSSWPDLPPAPAGDSLAVQAALHADDTPAGKLCPPQPATSSQALIATTIARCGIVSSVRSITRVSLHDD